MAGQKYETWKSVIATDFSEDCQYQFTFCHDTPLSNLDYFIKIFNVLINSSTPRAAHFISLYCWSARTFSLKWIIWVFFNPISENLAWLCNFQRLQHG